MTSMPAPPPLKFSVVGWYFLGTSCFSLIHHLERCSLSFLTEAYYLVLIPRSPGSLTRDQHSVGLGPCLTQDSAIFISRSVDGYTGDWNKSSGLSQVWKEIILLSSLHKKLIVPPSPNYLATTKMPIFRLLLFSLFLLTFGVCGLSLCVIYTLNSAGAASYSRCLWDLAYQRSITCSLGYPCEVGLWCLLKLASCGGA